MRTGQNPLRSERIIALVTVKLVHTFVWAVVAGSILVLPITALLRRFNFAVILTVLIVAECGVLAFNQGKCPLTSIAARLTADRADNFDIYLPHWLARHNKLIFGTLFVVNEVFVLRCWVKSSPF